MCPDRELLSAWLDGEVPSPWRESVERHVSSCSDCARAVDTMKRLSAALSSDARSMDARAERAKATVLDRLLSQDRPRAHAFSPWRRQLSLPLPFVAAAAALVAVLGLALVQTAGRNAELRMAVQQAVQAPSVAAAPNSMEAILQYLSSQDGGVNITIALPSGAGLDQPGEPLMVREADWQAGGGK